MCLGEVGRGPSGTTSVFMNKPQLITLNAGSSQGWVLFCSRRQGFKGRQGRSGPAHGADPFSIQRRSRAARCPIARPHGRSRRGSQGDFRPALQPSRSSVAVAAGHRIVHGGDRFTETCRITDEVINDMERLVQSRHRRTPAGNPDGGRRPVGLAGIEVRSRWEPCQCGSDRMAGSRVPILVIPTDEEASIAADTLATLTSTR